MRKQEELGISLMTVLLIMVIVSATITIIGYLLLKNMRIGHEAQVFESTKQASESMAVAIMDEIDLDNLTVSCNGTVTDWCPVPANVACKIKLPSDIVAALNASDLNGTALLLANCTQPNGQHAYTIQVTTVAPDNTTTTIYFIYQK